MTCPKRDGLGHHTIFEDAHGPTSRGVCKYCGRKTVGLNSQLEIRYGYYNREIGRRRTRHEIDLNMPGWRVGYFPENLGEAARAWRK